MRMPRADLRRRSRRRLAPRAAAAAAAPAPVTAWYMYGSSASDLRSYAYAHGCDFARAQPETAIRVLLLDFGAARKLDSSTWGAVDFSNTTFSNADILAALKRAADGYHNCHVKGGVDIVYGNEQLPPVRLGDVHLRRLVRGLPPGGALGGSRRLPARPGLQQPDGGRRRRHGAELGRAADHEAARERRRGAGLGPRTTTSARRTAVRRAAAATAPATTAGT